MIVKMDNKPIKITLKDGIIIAIFIITLIAIISVSLIYILNNKNLPVGQSDFKHNLDDWEYDEKH